MCSSNTIRSFDLATESLIDGQRLAALGDNVNSIVLDVHKDPNVLSKLIAETDLVISLLPFKLHTLVAKLCIKQKTDMVTTSYITPELQQLDDAFVL